PRAQGRWRQSRKSARSMSATSSISRLVNAIGMAPNLIRRWGISRSRSSAVRPLTDRSRRNDLGELVSRVTEDRRYSAAIVIRIDEGGSVDAIAPRPPDGERGIGFLDVDRFAVAASSQSCREPVGGFEQPGIAGFGGEQDQLADGHDTA